MCEEEAAKGGTQHRGTDHSGVDFHSIAPSTRPMTKALPSVAMSVAVEFRTGFARLALSGGRRRLRRCRDRESAFHLAIIFKNLRRYHNIGRTAGWGRGVKYV